MPRRPRPLLAALAAAAAVAALGACADPRDPVAPDDAARLQDAPDDDAALVGDPPDRIVEEGPCRPLDGGSRQDLDAALRAGVRVRVRCTQRAWVYMRWRALEPAALAASKGPAAGRGFQLTPGTHALRVPLTRPAAAALDGAGRGFGVALLQYGEGLRRVSGTPVGIGVGRDA